MMELSLTRVSSLQLHPRPWLPPKLLAVKKPRGSSFLLPDVARLALPTRSSWGAGRGKAREEVQGQWMSPMKLRKEASTLGVARFSNNDAGDSDVSRARDHDGSNVAAGKSEVSNSDTGETGEPALESKGSGDGAELGAREVPNAVVETLSGGVGAGAGATAGNAEYKPTLLDDIFLMLFRRKLAKETGWKSKKEGYGGMIEEAKRVLTLSPDRTVAEKASVRILLSFFPLGLLPLFKRFLAPGFKGKLGPYLSAAVTLVTCQWLMGPSKASEVQLPDGSVLWSGVKIDKCRFLEETKCAGSCIHTCKMPTQAFMEEHMGVPLHMEPNFEDFSCEFKFGVPAPPRHEDEILKKPCLSICPVAAAAGRIAGQDACPEVQL